MSTYITVIVGKDGLTVHFTQRHTLQPSADEIRRMVEDVAGWLQAWSAQLTDKQWQADIAFAERAELLRKQDKP